MSVDIYHSPISSFKQNDAVCPPTPPPPSHSSIYFSTASFFSFFFFYFSLSLQTDIHASLHMGFNLPLSPKIFLAQAWDKGIITSKGSGEGGGWGWLAAPSLPAERRSGQYANWEGELITGSVQRDAWPRPLLPSDALNFISVYGDASAKIITQTHHSLWTPKYWVICNYPPSPLVCFLLLPKLF